MSDNKLEPGSLEWKMSTAILHMNQKLKENGYNERERAFMWGFTVGELQAFLQTIWEHLHNEKVKQDEQIDQLHGFGAAAALEAAIADGSVFSESSRDPGEKPKPNASMFKTKKEGANEQSGTDVAGAKDSDLPASEQSGDSDSSARTIRTQS